MQRKSLEFCLVALVAAGVLLGVGCKEPDGSTTVQKDEKANDRPDNTSPTGIFGKQTNEIGEFDKDGDAKVSDGEMRPTNPLNPLGALNSYGPIVENLMKGQIKNLVEQFRALHGRYPESHKEFMDKIIHANGVELPVLPGGKTYQYDVENHELVVVEAQDK